MQLAPTPLVFIGGHIADVFPVFQWAGGPNDQKQIYPVADDLTVRVRRVHSGHIIAAV
jgi:hypothetical protein